MAAEHDPNGCRRHNRGWRRSKEPLCDVWKFLHAHVQLQRDELQGAQSIQKKSYRADNGGGGAVLVNDSLQHAQIWHQTESNSVQEHHWRARCQGPSGTLCMQTPWRTIPVRQLSGLGLGETSQSQPHPADCVCRVPGQVITVSCASQIVQTHSSQGFGGRSLLQAGNIAYVTM